ncbi:MAG: lysophospholipid acyltransferase family protein [Candidatus Aminicenantaceae bacterium]
MRTLILLLVYVLMIFLAIPLFLFCFVIRWRIPLLLLGKAAIAAGPRILGIQLDVSGRDSVDRVNPSVFMANHLSFLDGPLLFYLIPQVVRVIPKKEIFRIPIIGWAMRFVGFVPVDRKGLKSGRRSIERATRLIKTKGFSYLIFPEGTRSRDGKMQSFRRGAFFLAIDSQTPVVPITIDGTYDLMPKGSLFIKKGTVRVVFQKAVSVNSLTQEDMPALMEYVRAQIRSGFQTASNP